ncbi:MULTISPECIES: hypothetical protein [unclassified Nocardioides]|uniref:hypothetical protein n=1 Tax=unclassified Nocardioides TaxID=2615069 RepID=UPI00361B7D24
MPSRPGSSRPTAAALVLGAVALLGLAGCSDDDGHAAATPTADVALAVERALDARAIAVRRGDVDRFERVLGGGRAFREQQRTWYANLTQLPVERFRYRFDPASLVRDGDAYWVTVEEVLQLEGYDEAPVVSSDRFRLAPAANGSGRMRLVSVTDRQWEEAHDVQPQPWDLGPVDVRAGYGVLGIFDGGSLGTAGSVLTSVESGIADVAARVPHEWSRSVVVYALSDPAFMAGLDDVPGDDPEDLDAVSFPVGEQTRFVLNPRVLTAPSEERDRLVRHELTHVAVGTADDHAPVWLSEGIAEWVSVQPLAPEERRIPDAALAAAVEGVPDLPADDSFNDADSQAHYGLSWWVVEYVADAYGDDAPWTLLAALGEPGADADQVLRDDWGTSTADLTAQAEAMIIATYG